MKTEYRPRTPPPSPRSAAVPPPPPRLTNAPPPPPQASCARRPPPPPPPPAFARSEFRAAPLSVATMSSFCTAAPVSPAFAAQVQKSTTPQLQQLAKQLKMEAVLARFMGNPIAAQQAQQKLTYVEGQLYQRQVKSDLVSRFQYQREVGGMSGEQLSTARAKESLALFHAQLRGDPAGASEARTKLGLLDAEHARRETELAKFQQSLGGMGSEQLEALGAQLAEQFAAVLFDGSATGAQKDVAFNRLAVLLGEHLNRGLRSAATDWLFSK